MKVTNFKIDNWGELEVSAWHNGRKTTHTYNNVPKSIVLKFLNAKNAPEMSDVDGWMRDYQAKREKASGTIECGSRDWWSDK